MATILVAGNVKLLPVDQLNKWNSDIKLIIASQSKIESHSKNVVVHQVTLEKESYHQLFDAYSFDAVWFISGYADGGDGIMGETQLLDYICSECAHQSIRKLILLSTQESINIFKTFDSEGRLVSSKYPFSRIFCAAQSENSARYFAEQYGDLSIITLRLPYILGNSDPDGFFNRLFMRMSEKKEILLPYDPQSKVDFFMVSDLLKLLYAISMENEDISDTYFVTSTYNYTYSDLEQILSASLPGCKIIYENQPNAMEWPEKSDALRRIYGFVSTDNALEHVGKAYRDFLQKKTRRRSLSDILKLNKVAHFLYIALEILVLFVISEIIARYTSNSVYFKFVDVRLLFIVIVSTIHGIKAGLFSALLECIVLLFQYYKLGMDWILLFYNMENWIPFAAYLMCAAVVGHIRDKAVEKEQVQDEKYTLLRNKYLFLNDVYHGAIEGKAEYKKQILGFTDSFGKIFDAVQKLDSVLPERIFYEGLNVLETVLENHTIAIYTLDSWQKYARLAVCSGSQLNRLTKSLKIADIQEVYDTVKTGMVYRNIDMNPDMPMYAYAITQNNLVVQLILIERVNANQYGMHYVNMFRILCGLIQTSFLRAIDYERLMAQERYIADTTVAKTEYFNELLKIQQDMLDSGIASFVLLKLTDLNPITATERVGNMVRGNDTLGLGEDGHVYLLLTQMTPQNLPIVGERLASRLVRYELVPKVG